MSIQVFQHVKDAIRNLDPEDIRKHTERPVRLLLYADSEQQYREMEDYLRPARSFRGQARPGSPLIYRGIGRRGSAGARRPGDLLRPVARSGRGGIRCFRIRSRETPTPP